MATSGGQSGTPVSGGTPLAGTAAQSGPSNQLPLDVWREVMGYHPWHFWGLANDDTIKLTSVCNSVLPKYAWQKADMLSREAIRTGIIEAEDRLRTHLVFSVGRRFVEETIQLPRPRHYGMEYSRRIGADGRWLNVRLSEGQIRNIGTEAFTTLGATQAVTLSDEDSDGISETFTLTVSTTATDPDEIAVYFTAADRLNGEPVSEKYRIAPVHVTISGGVATIKGKAWLLVRPIKYEGVTAVTGLNPSDSGVLATELAVYRRYCDPTGTTTSTAQAMLIWESAPWPEWATSCDDGLTYEDDRADPAALAYAIARVTIRDHRLGEVGIERAVYNETTGQWAAVWFDGARQPDRITIRYEAGVPLSSMETTKTAARLPGRWDQIVARLACTEIPQRKYGCEQANMELYKWQDEPDNADMTPFGKQRGGIYAWDRVKDLGITRGMALG